MLSIFSCVCEPSVCLLWRNVYLVLWPIFWLGHLFFWSWAVGVACIFLRLFFVSCFICYYFLPFWRLSYLSLLFFGTLHSGGYIFLCLLCLSLLLSSICNASSDNHFAFLHFFFLWMVLITTSCTMLGTAIHRSSGTLCARSNPWIYLSLPMYTHKGFE